MKQWKIGGTGKKADIVMEVCRIPTAVNRGSHMERGPARLCGLQIGDGWGDTSTDVGMHAFVEARNGRLEIALVSRFDDITDDEWTSLSAFPFPAAMKAAPSLFWFMMEFGGLHFRASLATGHEDLGALRLASRDSSVPKDLAIYGLKGSIIRTAKIGIFMDAL